MLNDHRNTINELNKEFDEFKNKNKIKNEEYNDFIKTINEKDNEIENLKNLLN